LHHAGKSIRVDRAQLLRQRPGTVGREADSRSSPAPNTAFRYEEIQAMNVSQRIIVAGASLAGLRTIEALRQGGHDGEIVALSEERHMPYDRPPLSKRYLEGAQQAPDIALRRDGFDALDVEWRLGVAARSLDAEKRSIGLSDGTALDYGGLVIATGSRPRRLPFGGDLAGVHYLRSLDDASALRDEVRPGARLVVIGAGFIGMEVAATARALGAEVRVLEALSAPLLRGLGPLGEYVALRHRAHGVEIRCGVAVDGFDSDGDGRVTGVRLADGSAVDADIVVVGIGVVPNCEWLGGSGIEIDDGVVCDATGATSLPGVVAAGDVARWHNPLYGRAIRYEHWTSAVEQSRPAAARLLAAGPVPDLVQVPYVWSDQFELRLAIVGEVPEMTDGDAMHVCHGTLDEGRCLVLFGRAGKLVGAVGLRRPRQLNACSDLIAEGASWADAVAANA
jgi:NADPH-dependent 2,4-dienoyl-CoA reductase/sulfur reductase-like enzyme